MQAIAQHEFSTHLPAEVSENKPKAQFELSDLRERRIFQEVLMKHVRTEVLQAGMVVASDVIAKGNQLVFPKGYVLTERAIGRLEAYEIYDIRIEDPVGIEVEEIEDDEPDLSQFGGMDAASVTVRRYGRRLFIRRCGFPDERPYGA